MKTFLTFLMWTIVLAIGAVTAAANFRYGWLVGHGLERYIYAIGGTLLDVSKTFLPVMLGTFLAGRFTLGTFLRNVSGWAIWVLGVTWSLTCALGLYAISKDAAVGDTAGKQAQYRRLTQNEASKQAELAALANVRTAEKIEGEIEAAKHDRLWGRTNNCTGDTAQESRDFCKRVSLLTAEKANARPAAEVRSDRARLNSELHNIEVELSGNNLSDILKKADPATDALASITGFDPEKVRMRLPFIMAALFECVPLLPWIMCGTHSGKTAPSAPPVPVPAEIQTPKPEPKRKEKPQPAAPPDLPEDNGLGAQWAKDVALVRRKGSHVPSAEMFDDHAAWCRMNGHSVPNKTAFGKMMTKLGYSERDKIGGEQCYLNVAITKKVQPAAPPCLKVVK
jgi:hypothetical protein